MVNKSLLLGIALGAGFAAAGGVTAYQFFGGAERPQGAAAAIDDDIGHDAHAAHGSSEPEAHDLHDAHGSGATAAPAATPKIGRAHV